jgi:photosystem II stability/assembly factor-like uncharacterized protein
MIKTILFILATLVASLSAAEPIVYVTTLSTSYTHIGQKQTLSGLFYQALGDTSWGFMARPNNRVYSMDAYKPSQGRILAMATHTGVQQSWDAGKTWKTTSDWRMTEVSQIRFAQDNPLKIYAASPYGFYKTIDDGHTWVQHNTGLETPDATFVSAMVLDAGRPGTLFLSTEDGVYESIDDGTHWQRMDLAVRHIRTMVQHPTDPQVLFVGTEDHGLWKSSNQGVHWQKCDTGVLHDTFYGIVFDPVHPDTLYAGGFQTGVYKSIDSGKTWRHYFKGLDLLDIHSLAVDPQHTNRIYAGSLGKGMYLSEDYGVTWRSIGIDGGAVWTVNIINYVR